jgi:hypothetical protein
VSEFLPLDEAAERLRMSKHDLFKLVEEDDVPVAVVDGALVVEIEESE